MPSSTQLTAVTLLAVAGALTPMTVQAQERFSASGADVAVYNLAGQVRIEPTSGSSVIVEVTRVGADASRLRVENGSVRGREAIRVVYPGENIIYRPERTSGFLANMSRFSRTQFRVRDDGTFNDERLRGEGGGAGNRFGISFNEGHRVTIAGGGRGVEAHADLRVLVPQGKRVAVILGVGKLYARNVNGDVAIRTNSGDITADAVQGAFWLDTGSGDLKLTDVRARLEVHTGSGDVTLNRVHGAFTSAATGSGDVTGGAIETGELRANTGSGDVRLHEVRSKTLILESGSGSLDIGLAADVESLTAHTGSGDVTLGLPDGVGAQVEIDTGSGDVHTDVQLTSVDRRRSHFRGTLGDGRGNIRVETGSGDVHLVRR